MYTGEVLVTEDNIESLLSAADILSMCDLTKVSYRFMSETLNIENALLYWRLANIYEMTLLTHCCQKQVEKEIAELLTTELTHTLVNATEVIITAILSSNDLNVKHEEEVCEVLMKWLHIQAEHEHEVHPDQLLKLLRWSGIGADYIKSSLSQNATITADIPSTDFLTKVSAYLLSGVQFEGLQTFHRAATGRENCLMTLGMSNSVKMMTDIGRISLTHPDSVTTLDKLPTVMNAQSTACVLNDTVYVTGTGSGSYKEMWTYNAAAGWKQLTDMLTVRRIHCVAVVESTLYLLGGKVESEDSVNVIKSVETYNTKTSKWSPGGNLVHAVYNAACVTYRNAICLFGGEDSDKLAVDHVQVYNTVKKGCTLMAPMPQAHDALRGMLWEMSVILLGRNTCLIYNFETRTWLEREPFKTGVHLFAAVLDNGTIFIAGGGVSKRDGENNKTWTYTDEIKSVAVMDIIEDKEPVWIHHATLTKPGAIAAYVSIALPCLVVETSKSLIKSGTDSKDSTSKSEEKDSDEESEEVSE